MILRGILGLIFTLSISITNSQIIKGIITDEIDKSPLAGATVKLLALPDSSAAYSIVTGKSGDFNFQNVKAGKYVLSISSIGYGTSLYPLNAKDSTLDLGTVAVSKNAKTLTEVTITTTAPPVKQKIDTVEYSANQFKVNPDANAEDLIKKMPGVTVDRQGNVTAQGEPVKKSSAD